MKVLPTKDLRLVYHVACTLGEVTNGYLETRLSKLCTSEKINMWAKYKPVRHNFTSNRPSNWWKGGNGRCSIDYKTYSSVYNMINAIDAGDVAYTYLRPTGGASSPYRLGDFAGYNIDATPPIKQGVVPGKIYNTDTQVYINCIRRGDSADEISVSDLYEADLVNMYFGVAFKRVNNSGIMWMTGGDDTVVVPTGSNFAVGQTYHVYQFLTDVRKTNFSDPDRSGVFIPLPGSAKQEVSYVGSSTTIGFFNVERSLLGAVSGQIRIKNVSNGTLTYTDASISVRYGDKAYSEPFEPDESTVYLDTPFTVRAGETKTIDFTSKAGLLIDFDQRGGALHLFLNKAYVTSTLIPQSV